VTGELAAIGLPARETVSAGARPDFSLADWFKYLIWREKARSGARACSHVIMT
jgi:hypothetical protein